MSGLMDERHDWLREIAESETEPSELVACAKGSLGAIAETELEWYMAIAEISRKQDEHYTEVIRQIKRNR